MKRIVDKPIPQEVYTEIERFEKGEITIDQLVEILRVHGLQLSMWQPGTQAHPVYKDNNESRAGFKYNPYHHLAGKFFQNVIKKILIKFIIFAHRYPGILSITLNTKLIDYLYVKVQEHYDKDAYVFDDPRLSIIQEFCKNYATQNFKDYYPYKYNYIVYSVEILLALCKEDIYYRARILDMLYGAGMVITSLLIEEMKEQTGDEKLYKQHTEALKLLLELREYLLTDKEAANIRKWH